ncbi:MAG: hypothetical protein OXE76_04085 [Alphaproteobacteria bacterium]|nr:hypothetical protein [Alphaproteobacteria bacterium]
MAVDISAVRDVVYIRFMDRFEGEYNARIRPPQTPLPARFMRSFKEGGRLSLSGEIGPQPNDMDFWVRLVLRHNGRRQTSMGRAPKRRFRTDGSIIFAVFVPLQSNNQAPILDVDTAMGAACAVFDSMRLESEAVFWDARPGLIARTGREALKVPWTQERCRMAEEADDFDAADPSTWSDEYKCWCIPPDAPLITTYGAVPREEAPEGQWLPAVVEVPFSYDEMA